MDGILYDSMPYHAKAWKRLTEEMGMYVPEDEFYQYEGMTGVETINLLSNKYLGREVSEEEALKLYQRKADFFYSYGKAEKMPGAEETLTLLKERGIECVLVTGSGQKSLIDRLHTDFPGIFSPELMVTSANVSRGKPHPEPYLKGMQLTGVSSGECIAIDNAPLGVRSASLSKAFTIGVKTGPIETMILKENGADVVIEGMVNLPAFLKTYLNK